MADRVNPGSTAIDDRDAPRLAPAVESASYRQSFGARFKREREQRGLTLQDISFFTKIHPRFLTAIEEAEFDQLPGGILNKGFIRAYGECVGIDREAIAHYADTAERILPITLGTVGHNGPNKELKSRPTHRVNRTVLALGLVGLAVGLIILNQYGKGPNRFAGSVPDSFALQSSGSAGKGNPHSQVISHYPSVATKGMQQTVKASLETVSSSECANAPSARLPSLAAVEYSAAVLCIAIRAREDAWVSINADDKLILQSTLIAPTQKLIVARHRVVIRAGNIGALDFFFNGQPLPPQGDYDEAKTLSFNTKGLERHFSNKVATAEDE